VLAPAHSQVVGSAWPVSVSAEVAADDAPHCGTREGGHHRRPRAERQRTTPQITIAAVANEAPTAKTITPAMSYSFTLVPLAHSRAAIDATV
jgi:hypothetical protein